MLKKFIYALLILFSNQAMSADYLDTAYGPDGIEVHLLKVNVVNNVMSVTFMLDNSSDQKYKFNSMVVSNVFYTTKDKKYPVLKDADEKYLASTITYGDGNASTIFVDEQSDYSNLTISAGGKKVGWVKFEAPADDEWPVEVTLPGISPFVINQPN